MKFLNEINPFWLTVLLFTACGIGYGLAILYIRITGRIIHKIKTKLNKDTDGVKYEGIKFSMYSFFFILLFAFIWVIILESGLYY